MKTYSDIINGNYSDTEMLTRLHEMPIPNYPNSEEGYQMACHDFGTLMALDLGGELSFFQEEGVRKIRWKLAEEMQRKRKWDIMV